MNDFLAHRIVRKIVFVGFVLLNSKAGAVAPGWESTAIALPSNAAQSMIISWDSRADDRRYEQRRYEQQRYEQQRYEQQRYERRRAERLYDEKRSQTQRDAAQRSNEKRAAERRQNAQCLNQPYWDGQQWYAQTPEALCPGTNYDAGGGY